VLGYCLIDANIGTNSDQKGEWEMGKRGELSDLLRRSFCGKSQLEVTHEAA
jgi:hypothetical protein